MSEVSDTSQYFNQGDKLRADGVVLECTFVSYQERPKEGGQPDEVERYNFTYSFRPHEDMERERRETTPPAEVAETESQAPSTPNNSNTNTEGQAY